MTLRLPAEHSLWAHCLWNASRCLAQWIDRDPSIVAGKAILELGAGAALPSIVAVMRGARHCTITDYPEQEIIDNIRHNVTTNLESDELRSRTTVMGYQWGSGMDSLLPASEGAVASQEDKFDCIFMSDLIFNHSAHGALLDTCEHCLKRDGIAYVIFSHHRPWKAKQDMNFFVLAKERGYAVTKIREEKFPVMFEEDPGDREVRETVHVYEMRLPRNNDSNDDDDTENKYAQITE